MVLILVLWRKHDSHSNVTTDVHMYDYVGPPELPPRRSNAITAAFAGSIQMKKNAVYASNIQTEQNAAYAGIYNTQTV